MLEALIREMKENVKNPNEWVILGDKYHHGEDGRIQHDAKAKICYEQALLLDKEHRAAKHGLLKIEMKEKNWTTAEQWVNLGCKYFSGKDEDKMKAKICFEETLRLDNNHQYANFYLGIIYKFGCGVPKDLVKAKAYFEKMQEEGFGVVGTAKRYLLEIEMEENNWTTAEQWNDLGNKYFLTDNIKAMICYEEVLKLDNNHHHANYRLGFIYRYGCGAPRDLTKAKVYFEKIQGEGLWVVKAAKRYLLEIEMAENNWTTAGQWDSLGDKYYYHGENQDYIKASICYEEVLKLNENKVHVQYANYRLGLMYKNGYGVNKDLVKATYHLRNALDQGLKIAGLDFYEIEAPLILSALIKEMKEDIKDPHKWFILSEKYNVKNAPAEYYFKAKICYEQILLLDQNYYLANYHLGLLYKEGLGVIKDIAKAKMYFEKADAIDELLKIEMAEKQWTTADQWSDLGNKYLSSKEYDKTRICYEEALKLDESHRDANYGLGLIYRKGYRVAKDFVTAKAYFQTALNHGNEEARPYIVEMESYASLQKDMQGSSSTQWNSLGLKYHHGSAQDYVKAKICYKQALKLDNNREANYNLGLMYMHGHGVAKDLIRAEAYFERADAQQHRQAKCELLKIEMAKNNWTTANEWIALGNRYRNGDGRIEDWDKAQLCYEEALKINEAANDLTTTRGWNAVGEKYHYHSGQELINAVICYRKALELDPSFETAQKNIQRLEDRWKSWSDNIFEAAYNNDVIRLKYLLFVSKHSLLDAKFVEPTPWKNQVGTWSAFLAKKATEGVAAIFAAAADTVTVAKATGIAGLVVGGATTSTMGAVIPKLWTVYDKQFWYDMKVRENWTPLHFAAWGNAHEAAEFLIRRGANTTLKDNYGKNVFRTWESCICS